MSRPFTRRDAIRLGSAGAAGLVAGCASSESPESSVPSATAAPPGEETPATGDGTGPPDGTDIEDPPAGTDEEQAVPDPIGYLITRWRQDPFARGSYSFLARGSEPEDRSRLAAPIDDRLFFAGEATTRDFPATVHGALLSGRRAADEVLDTDASEIAIVGAGVAGLGAAQHLHAAGRSVTVVEGRARVGGRVWTDMSLSAPIDLGASWIHGISDNPLTEIADDAGITRVTTDYDNVVVRNDQGAVLDGDDLTDSFLEVSLIEHEYAADVEDLSEFATEEGEDVVGDDVVFPNGYMQVVDELRTGYEIVTDTEVREIAHDDTGVTITTSGGSVRADAAIVTVPLGVLKAGTITFDPPLADDKLGAIDRLGMGLLDKVVLEFDEVFWEPDIDVIGHQGDTRGHFAEWVNVARYTGRPILMGFNASSVADAFELEDDETIAAAAVAALRGMYGR